MKTAISVVEVKKAFKLLLLLCEKIYEVIKSGGIIHLNLYIAINLNVCVMYIVMESNNFSQIQLY